jgi:hypothetical protein
MSELKLQINLCQQSALQSMAQQFLIDNRVLEQTDWVIIDTLHSKEYHIL